MNPPPHTSLSFNKLSTNDKCVSYSPHLPTLNYVNVNLEFHVISPVNTSVPILVREIRICYKTMKKNY